MVQETNDVAIVKKLPAETHVIAQDADELEVAAFHSVRKSVAMNCDDGD